MSLKPHSMLCCQVHVFERTNMSHKGAAVLVGVNGLLALEAIDQQMLQGLLEKAIKLEGSGA
jgi:hypothetical protein